MQILGLEGDGLLEVDLRLVCWGELHAEGAQDQRQQHHDLPRAGDGHSNDNRLVLRSVYMSDHIEKENGIILQSSRICLI